MEQYTSSERIKLGVKGVGGIALVGLGFKGNVTDMILTNHELIRNTSMMLVGSYGFYSSILEASLKPYELDTTTSKQSPGQQE